LKFTEALQILQSAPQEAPPFGVTLACGFSPLHIQTFLAAHLQQALADRKICVSTGLFGDLVGTLESLQPDGLHAIALVIEWADLDPRLGFREAGAWGSSVLPDMLTELRARLARIEAGLQRVPAGIPVALSLPTLPLPPSFHTPGWQAADGELLIDQAIAEFAARLSKDSTVRIVNSRRLANDSPPAARFDLKSDLLTGLPYTLAHASALGESLARLLIPSPPKKGLITDLDDTLWNGIVGDLGPEGVAWDLTSHQQLHGLYQKLLSALSDQGVLIAVASKNDLAVVEQTFQRDDILLRPDRVFPFEVHWNSKSGSVDRILRTWNIAADSVVMVDDSPMELAEVAAAHPGIECIPFPKGNYTATYRMFQQLRDLFGKDRISPEDASRLNSIRQGAVFLESSQGSSAPETFLAGLNPIITLDFRKTVEDPRALELVNKTNQFNLNGKRCTEAEWSQQLSEPESVLMVASYTDKFGALGRISVLLGRLQGATLRVGTWVMSCRAFARRIEYQCLKNLFERRGVGEIEFQFAPNSKNGPLQEFFSKILGSKPAAPFTLSREAFERECPQLYHQVSEVNE
jgi:FkbH-like protein